MGPDLLLKQNVDVAGHFTSEATLADILPEAVSAPSCKTSAWTSSKPLIPAEPLNPGEQYRFHFNAGKCIGCECCVVACNEQNGNPADVNWRRVGEVEAGTYPSTKRYTLSMGCNHCVDPACLTGCPTDAYEKDPITGIVRHKADSCIGCQYCIWNCPYDVPQFNEERNIVTKCDMCYGRLGMGSAPACASACPEEAITIEKVNIEEWKANHTEADAPGMPDSGQTLSTTRITLPDDFPTGAHDADEHRLEPEDPHTPLIFMTVLTQLSVGAFFSIWIMEMLAPFVPSLSAFRSFMGAGAMAALFAGGVALAVSVLHLGRPLYAYKALKMWRRSWLSREVLLFGVFSALATAYAGLWLEEVFLGILQLPDALRALLGGAVVLSGLGGILCSGFIYMVPARPSWNTVRTPIRFFLTGLILGPIFTMAVFWAWRLWFPQTGSATTLTLPPGLWMGFLVTAACAQLGLLLASVFTLVGQEVPELRGTAILLTRRFKNSFLWRLALIGLGGVVLPGVLMYMVFGSGPTNVAWIFTISVLSLALSLGGEFLGRYLFFVTVVPKNIAGSFFKK